MRFLATVLVCLAFTAATADASDDQQIISNGVYCSTGKTKFHSVGCTLLSGRGYLVVLDKRAIMITERRSGNRVFFRYQSQAG